MHTVTLSNIPFQLDFDQLLQKLHIKKESAYADDLKRLVGEAQTMGRPKAIYRLGFIEEKGDDYVIVDGFRLTSRVLRVNLEQAHRVFAYVATCGMELQEWSNSITDMLERYWADSIKEMALGAAVRTLNEQIRQRYQPGATSTMNPGSLADWPLREQKALFALLGDPVDTIGVQLTASCLMIPNKSVSGIRFPTTESFESCQLCPREDCPGRRAPYDATLYDRKYAQVS